MSDAGADQTSEQISDQTLRAGFLTPRRKAFLMVVVGLTVFALALTFIWNVLHEYTFNQIAGSVLSIPASALLLSVAAMAVSFAGISVYDYMALPYTEKRMPLGKTIFASFCAFAISNSLGMTAVTSNAIRYRLYSSWGLGAAEVGIVALITTTFLLFSAMTLVAGGLIMDKDVFETVFGLPPIASYSLGVGLGGLALAGVIFFLGGPGTKSYRKFSINLPGKKHVITQWIIGMVDWTTMAAVLYFLLPTGPEFTFVAFVPIFVAAHYAGAVSGLPGGIGVFEAIVLLLVPTGDELTIAAGLITFRVIYYFLPLIISVIMLTGHQALQARNKAGARNTYFSDFMNVIAPVLFSLMTFIAGAVMLVSSATPRYLPNVEIVARFVPQAVIELSHLFASAIGTLLLLVAMGLHRRLYGAWRLAVILFAAGAAFTLFKGGPPLEAILIASLGVCLYVSRDAFFRKGRLKHMDITGSRIGAVIGTAGLALWAGFYAYRNKEYSNDLWWQFALQDDASRFLRAALTAAAILLIYFIWRMINPPRAIGTPENSDTVMEKVRAVMASAENATSEASLALIGDKKFMFSDSGNSFIMYGVKGQNWLSMGEPVGLESERKELMRKFCEQADQNGAWPGFYGVRAECLTDCIDLGLAVQKVGEKALVPLKDLSFQGKKRAKLRQSRNRAIKAGCTFSIIYPEMDSPEMDRLKAISDAWLEHHKGREKSFSLGKFDRALFAGAPIAVAWLDGEIIAFSNLWITHDKREVSLDLMRYTPTALQGIMDYLFTEIMLWGSAEGYEYFSLGKAPLAGLDNHKLAPLMSKIGAMVFKYGGRIYGFEGLRRFKSKFDPVWEPSYLAVPSQFVMPIAMGNLALLSSGGLKGLLQRES